MTHCRSPDEACIWRCRVGSATLTTVPSMKAIEEPRMVAASTHPPALRRARGMVGAVQRTHSSAARGMIEAMAVIGGSSGGHGRLPVARSVRQAAEEPADDQSRHEADGDEEENDPADNLAQQK